jgi:RNA polymerase sigma factor (sigma-70 family)
MAEHDGLAERFEASRRHLRGVAYRMLGSPSEAEDAVQEAWLRLSRSDTSEVENLGGWLTTVVARVCLDMLRSRKSRREEPLDSRPPDEIASGGDSPEHGRLMADSVGLAMLVVLETLTPVERVAFVLHDIFDLPFEDIAPIVGRTPVAARQLASRARRRVQGAPAAPDADRTRQREIVDAFLAASRGGDFSALLAVLDPNVVLRADPVAVAESLAAQARGVRGAPALAPEIRGAEEVARTFAGRARAAQPALITGIPGLVWAPGGETRAVFGFTISGGKIVGIELIADPERIRQLDVTIL